MEIKIKNKNHRILITNPDRVLVKIERFIILVGCKIIRRFAVYFRSSSRVEYSSISHFL